MFLVGASFKLDILGASPDLVRQRYQQLKPYGMKLLAEKIEKKEEIVAGCEEEMEIRASMVIAVDLARKELQTRFPEATAIQLNDIFCHMGRTLQTNSPHHRTKTIWY